MEGIALNPIGVVHSPFAEVAGTPIQPALARGAEGTVEVFEPYVAGLKDLAGFERIWLLVWLHRAPPFQLEVKPFLDDTPRGLFATRAPCRPNPIGLSPVRLLGIDGHVLRVGELDVVDGTPLLDIKPYATRFDVFDVQRCGWLDCTTASQVVADNRFVRDEKEA